MSLPKVMVILCLMFLCFNLIAGAKTPEPDEPWAHKETPDELEQKVLQIKVVEYFVSNGNIAKLYYFW